MTAPIDALRGSVAHLHTTVEGLTPDQITGPAYPSEWTVADALSHIGSGAVILNRWLDDTITGAPTPDDFAPAVWDVWNGKDAQDQAADALAADRALLDALEAVSANDRDTFTFSFGPRSFDFDGFVGLRLNEHALHTWDVEVAARPDAPVNADAVPVVIDQLAMIVGFTGKPDGPERQVAVRTTDPERNLSLDFGAESVSLTPSEPVDAPDLELAAEAFIRLIYGRLDADHTPTVTGPADLDALRAAFPGA